MGKSGLQGGAGSLLTAPVVWFLISLLAIAIVASLGPAEQSLGVNVRVVYLHGAWVWAALAGFVAAGLCGAVGLLTRQPRWTGWSAALGRSGLLFWITYLPISLWAMQANWNGLFLAEPRWRLAAVFAVSGLLLQVGLALLRRPMLTALGNLAFIGVLLGMLSATQDVLHPASPIFSSGSLRIQVYFMLLLLLTLLAVWQAARGFMALESRKAP